MDYSSDQLTNQYTPFSTRTLGLQTLVLSFLSVWIFAVLVPSTLFSRTRSAHLTITSGLGFDASQLSLEIDTEYWDYGFCELLTHNLNRDFKLTDIIIILFQKKVRCLAAAPWFSLIFSLPASIVTWVAWRSQSSSRII